MPARHTSKMKALFLTGIVTLFLATEAAHAQVKKASLDQPQVPLTCVDPCIFALTFDSPLCVTGPPSVEGGGLFLPRRPVQR
jgi:hypothetical protein